MAKKKTKKIFCIIFPKEKFRRKMDALYWCSKNSVLFDLNIPDKRSVMKKIDGEYVIKLRPKYKFKNTRKESTKGIKLLKGYLL